VFERKIIAAEISRLKQPLPVRSLAGGASGKTLALW